MSEQDRLSANPQTAGHYGWASSPSAVLRDEGLFQKYMINLHVFNLGLE
jgi:hypothetical protein